MILSDNIDAKSLKFGIKHAGAYQTKNPIKYPPKKSLQSSFKINSSVTDSFPFKGIKTFQKVFWFPCFGLFPFKDLAHFSKTAKFVFTLIPGHIC